MTGLQWKKSPPIFACLIFLITGAQKSVATAEGSTDHAASASIETVTTAEQTILLDLIGALAQVESLKPQNTTLYVKPPQDTFEASLGYMLDTAGYEIQLATDLQQPNTVEYFVNQTNAGDENVKTYQLQVGPVKVRRDYLVDDNKAQPQTTMYLQGADAGKISLNDEIFNLEYAEIYQNDYTPAAEQAQEAPALVLQTADNRQSYQLGDPIFLSVSINLDAKIYCYYRDGHGQIARVYPNRFSTDNLVTANQKVAIPSVDTWAINATRVGKTDDFLCLATDPENHELISALDKEPDLEPLAARSLSQIYEKLTSEHNVPMIKQEIQLIVE